MRAEWIVACLLFGNLVLLFFVASPGWWLLGSVATWCVLFFSGVIHWTPTTRQNLNRNFTRSDAFTTDTYIIERACRFHVPALLGHDLIPVPDVPVQEGVSFYFFELQDGRMLSLTHATLDRLNILNKSDFPAQEISITRIDQTGEVIQLAVHGKPIRYQQGVCILPQDNYALIRTMPLVVAEGLPSALVCYSEVIAMFTEQNQARFGATFGQIPAATDENVDVDLAVLTEQHALLTERYCPLRVLYFNHPQSCQMIWFVELHENLLLHLCGRYLQGVVPDHASVITLLRHKQSGAVYDLRQEGGAVTSLHIAQPSYFGVMKLNILDGQFCADASLDEIQRLLTMA